MPTYEYRCPEGHEFEKFFRTISGAPTSVSCPTCGAPAERLLSGGAGLLFKGSGFYLTDYGKNAHATKGPKAAPSDSGTSAATGGSPADSKGSTGSASGRTSDSSGSGQSSTGSSAPPSGGSASGGSGSAGAAGGPASGGSASGGSASGGAASGGKSGGKSGRKE